MKYDYILPVRDYFESIKTFKSPNTYRSYVGSVEKFFDYLQIQSWEDIQSITPAICNKYVTKLGNERLVETTINTHIANLKALFSSLADDEYLEKNPFLKVKKRKVPSRKEIFLQLDEARKLIASCTRLEDKAIIYLMLTTGLRRDEVVNLELEGYTGTHIHFFGKGNKEAVLPIMPEVREVLDKYIKIRNKKYGNHYKYLFVSKSHALTERGDGKLSGEAIRLKVKRAMQLAGFSEKRIAEITPHKLRHTFTANLILANVDIALVKEALRHSKLETTMGYAHMNDTHVDQSILSQPALT